MTHSTSRRDFVVALLIAVWAHAGLFFVFVMLLVFDLIAARVIEEDPEPKKKDRPIKMQIVYEEETGDPTAVVAQTLSLEEEKIAEPEPVMPDQPAFVRTSEKQTSSETPDETDLIGERNTTATSDEGAVVGDEKMTALAGEMEKNDVKTFNSDFSDGESAGPKEGLEEAMDTGKGEAEVNEEAMAATDPQPESFEEPLPEMEEDLPKPKKDPLVSIDAALAILEEAIGDEKKEDLKKPSEKIEETMPEKPAENQQEASNQDGGFTPKTRKTRVAGVLSADGEGSLNVADTPAGRYQANLLKKLETEWQMENIRNRSLLAPGNVTLYFIVDQKGKVSRQKRVAMVGASGTQWGMILRALNEVRPPPMPKAVINDLDGDVLELIVTFNY
jgi:hypothetical protein